MTARILAFRMHLKLTLSRQSVADPETVLQAAEIGIGRRLAIDFCQSYTYICSLEHNLGLTCDPIDGLVQVPCIERNSLGGQLPRISTSPVSDFAAAVKAVTAAQLSMASQSVYSVTLDEAIEAMRLTAVDMSVKYKETSLSVCAALYIHNTQFSDGLATQGLAVRVVSTVLLGFVLTLSLTANSQDSTNSACVLEITGPTIRLFVLLLCSTCYL